MGLTYPEDLGAWQAWQDRRQSIPRRLRRRYAGDEPDPVLATTDARPEVIVAFRSTSASKSAALLEPIPHLGSLGLGLLSDQDRGALVDRATRSRSVATTSDVLCAPGDAVDALVPSGIGRPNQLAIATARATGGRVFVAQHGLLTPFTPPLPRDCTLLAWTEADGAFWRSGRNDVTVEVVGSQLLWNAARREGAPVDPGTRPTFLGQLHAAELDRRDLARVSFEFCRTVDGTYRPHPAEVDKASRIRHAIWRRRGVRFDTSGVSLENLATPVAAIFSTGVLEAAAAGRPAWVYHPNPPTWVAEMWDRYGLRRWGDDPTPALPLPDVEPAERIATILGAAAPVQER